MSDRSLRRKRGDVLQPGRFTPEVVRALKMKPREWATQYAQDPAPSTGNVINPAWFRFYKGKEAPEFELVVLSVDCAFKSAAQNDHVAIQKWGMVGARSYLIERDTDHMGYVQTKARIRSMQQHGRRASCILIEDKANGSAVIEELKADPDFGAAVIPIDPQGDKKSRAHAASTDIEAGSVYLPEELEGLSEFLRTLGAFPAARFDDDVDSLSQFLNWRRTRSLSLTLVDYFKRQAREIASGVRDAFGELLRPKPKPALAQSKAAEAETRVDGYAASKKPSDPCPNCKSTSTVVQSNGMCGVRLHCNQCGADDGVLPPKPAGPCACGNFLPQKVAGQIRCGNCGWQSGVPGIAVMGVSRADYARGVGRFRGYGRF